MILKEYPFHYYDIDAVNETIKKFNKNITDDEAYQLYLGTLKDENNDIISIFNDYKNKYKWYEIINNKGNLNVFDKVFLSYEEGYVKTNIEAFINVEKN